MIETYTMEEMVAEWKLRRGMMPLRTDAVADRVDGIDVDTLLRSMIAQWYGRLLREAPAELLPQADLASKAKVRKADGDGAVEVKLPQECVRVLRVKLSDWLVDSIPIEATQAPKVETLQRSPYSRARQCNPVALAYPDRLMLYSTSAEAPELDILTCVAAPLNGTIALDSALLDTIPDSFLDY